MSLRAESCGSQGAGRAGVVAGCCPHFFVVAALAFARQSSTALLQSLPAVRVAGSGVVKTSPSSMMQGGTASLHFFRHTFAGAPPPHSMLKTWDLQHANVEFWPRTLAQV